MKKILFHVLTAVLCLSGLCSCHGDLDIIYDGTLSASNMWRDPSDLEQSVPGIYQRLRNYFSDSECNVFYLGEVRVGDTMWGPSLESNVQDAFKKACRRSLLSGGQTIGWSGLYSAIGQANSVLAHSAECNAKEDVVKWADAQALFARAYCYFYAARIWGDVPLLLRPVEGTDQPECHPAGRTPKAEVYAQIEKDINACVELGDKLGNEKYLATKEALDMLKAEFALWMYTTQGGDKTKYLTMAEEALTDLGISDQKLLADYSKVFDRENKKNAEIVFALANTVSTAAGYQVYFCQPANLIKSEAQCSKGGPVPISSTQWWSYSQAFVDKLKAQEAQGDKRVGTNLGYGPYAASDGHEITWCNKLLGDMSKAPVVLDNDLIYYRYAQAVMMDAELKYYQGKYDEALASLNLVAKRAYGDDNHYTNTAAASVLDAIVNEYYLEFPAEGVIWWALIRTGKIWDVAPNSEFPDRTFNDMKASNANILLWPIATGSITKNPNLSQTEGWN